MIKYVLAAAFSLAMVQPASAATIFDYNIYANGNAFISGGSYGDIASGSFANANGSGGTNFSSWTSSTNALGLSANSLSSQLAALGATGTISHGQWTPGAITLTGSGSGVNVFNIDGSQWSQLYALTFAGPGAGAIVNVSGASLSNSVNLNFGALTADQVIFNFHDATAITMNGMNVRGSILAPSAFVNLQGGSVAGSVISNSFHSEGTKIGGTAFTGFSPVAGAVPEPSTWAMLILGFGAIGTAMRRRRARLSVSYA